ncbi:MAG: TfoX/Sxy family protein [Peptococcaceae bacterium]
MVVVLDPDRRTDGGIKMAISEEFKDYVVDQLGQLGYLNVRKMFGGAGIYHEGLIFGLIADDVLYFKVDESNRGDYTGAGMEPFRPFAGKPMSMSYYEVPGEVLEDSRQLFAWACKACLVSQKASAAGKKRKKGHGIKPGYF